MREFNELIGANPKLKKIANQVSVLLKKVEKEKISISDENDLVINGDTELQDEVNKLVNNFNNIATLI